jgi:hypothetical protein
MFIYLFNYLLIAVLEFELRTLEKDILSSGKLKRVRVAIFTQNKIDLKAKTHKRQVTLHNDKKASFPGTYKIINICT